MSIHARILRKQGTGNPAPATSQSLNSVTSQINTDEQLSPAQVLQLQRTIGNQAVMRMLASSAAQRSAEVSDADHTRSCKCAACVGTALNTASPASAQRMTIQRTPSPDVIQRQKCTCGKSGNRHTNKCPRSKTQLKVDNTQQQTQNKQASSWDNMKTYRPHWIKPNGITPQTVKTFCAWYGPIPGHGTDPNSPNANEQGVTSQALGAYRTWHGNNIAPWQG